MIGNVRNFVRLIFLVCIILLITGDYTGLIHRLLFGKPNSAKKNTFVLTQSEQRPDVWYGIDNPNSDDSDSEKNWKQEKSQVLSIIKDACLPKLICELNASSQIKSFTESEKSLLTLIRDTSITTIAELTSIYHYAAHMGQLISGVDGTGCNYFYPHCPIPRMKVLQILKKVQLQ